MLDSLIVRSTQPDGSPSHQHYKTTEQVCLRLSLGLPFNPAQSHGTTDLRSFTSQRTSFSIIIPAGQDISLVYIGWTTQHFKYYPELFQKSSSGDDSMVGCKAVKLIDSNGASGEYVTGYMTCLVDLFKKSQFIRMDSSTDNVSSEFIIGCKLDQQTAAISYIINKEHISSYSIKVSVTVQGLVCEYFIIFNTSDRSPC